MLSLNNVTMRYGAKLLFEDVTCSFLEGRRYAITGPNGAGKTTLMKILTRDIEPTKGSVTRPKKLGVLRQDQFAFDAFRVIDTVIMGNAPLWRALEERDALYAKPHDELTDEDGLLLGEPTNHLDLDSVHWLQDYLCEYQGVLIVISHDRHFLNSVCTHVADIDYQTVIMYNGGYDDMVVAKTSIRSRIESENAQREK